MKIRYNGGRTSYKISLNRKSYYFNIENNRILDIQDQAVVNYIFSLDNRQEFEVLVENNIKKEEDKPDNFLKCNICGFIAKSSFGLSAHNTKHKKGGKK